MTCALSFITYFNIFSHLTILSHIFYILIKIFFFFIFFFFFFLYFFFFFLFFLFFFFHNIILKYFLYFFFFYFFFSNIFYNILQFLSILCQSHNNPFLTTKNDPYSLFHSHRKCGSQ